MSTSTFAARLAVLLMASLLVSVLQRRVGGGVRRKAVMLAGTLGGLVLGVLMSSLLPSTIRVAGLDAVDLSLLAGIFVGWALAWPIARSVDKAPL